MLVLGPIAFAAPWLLGAVLLLPAVWWLLRLTPPVPRRVRFPAVRLLRDLIGPEETPAHTPLWLLVLRLLIAGLVIVGLAGPVLHPTAALPGNGPLVLIIDDGWSAARGWPVRQRLAADLLAQAERQGRDVVVLTTAPVPAPIPAAGAAAGTLRPLAAGPMRAVDARRLVQGLEPRPWPSDRVAALAALKDMTLSGSLHAVWLSDGTDSAGVRGLALTLQKFGGGVEVVADLPADLPNLLLPPLSEGEALTARLVRAAPGPARSLPVRAAAGDDRLLALQPVTFAAGALTAEARIDLPLDLRNQVIRLSIEGEATVGATVLLDERWRRRPVGLVASRSAAEAQPLLGDLYYLERALAPFAEVRRGDLAQLIKGDVSLLVLADIGTLAADETKLLEDWLGRGGLLVRFAGPRLAHAADTLLPVRLRQGDRVLGGALSWAKPARLAPFEAASPFAGLTIPADVTVERQVLAEPSLDTADRTWAQLTDGTPLVTAARRGQGSVVLIHTTATPDWSNLALSGLFVDMMRRLVALSAGVQGEEKAGLLAPLELLDGLGRLGEPPGSALPLPAQDFARTAAGPQHPPGFYGSADLRRALNLTGALTRIEPLKPLPSGVKRSEYRRTGETDLKPLLLLAALCLLLADLLIALAMRGLLLRRRASITASS